MSAQPPTKSPLHDFPLTFLKWNTKKDRRYPPPHPPSSSSSPPSVTVGNRSSRHRRPSAPAEPAKPEPEVEAEEGERQWNLRPRRRAEMTVVDESAVEGFQKPTRLSGGGGDGGDQKRFWIALSKDEIEEDIYSMTGSKPSRRPRKHSKIVQKQLDNVFPGLWLVGFSPYSYRHYVPPPKN